MSNNDRLLTEQFGQNISVKEKQKDRKRLYILSSCKLSPV